MGTPQAEDRVDVDSNPPWPSWSQGRPSQLVSEAIRRDLLTLADLPGQEAVRSTYRRELLNGLKST